MLKFIGSTVLGLGLLVLAGAANAAPPCHAPEASAPVAYQAVPMSQASRAVRSYSYEPGGVRTYSYEPAAGTRSYGRSYSRPASGGFRDATSKGRGNY